jgi:PAS domain S-box-containing protein
MLAHRKLSIDNERLAAQLSSLRNRQSRLCSANRISILEWELATGQVVFEACWEKASPAHATLGSHGPSILMQGLHPDDQPGYIKALESLSTGSCQSFEWQCRLVDGQKMRWMRDRVSLQNLGPEGGLQILVSRIPMAQQEKLEQELAKSLSQYRYLFDFNPSPIIIWDFETKKILDCNRTTIRLYGYTKDEFLEKSILEIRHPDYVNRELPLLTSDNYADYLGKADHDTWKHLKKNGQEMMVQIRGHLMAYQGHKAVLVSVTDITPREKLLDELTENRKRLDHAQEMAQLGYWRMELSTEEIECSPRIFNMWEMGQPPERVPVHDFFLTVLRNDKPGLEPKFKQAVAQGTGIDHQFRILTAHKRIKWIHIRGNIARSEGEIPLYIEGMAQDVSHLRAMQDLLQSGTQMAKVGTWEINLLTDSIEWSEMTGKIHEADPDYRPTLEEGINFYREDMRNMVRDSVNNAINLGQSFDFEAPLIMPNGTEKWVWVLGQGEFWNDRCIRVYGSIQDIHERKTLEIRIHKAYQELDNYKLALESSASILIADTKGIIREVNKSTCDLSGYSRAELIGQHTRINKSGFHPIPFYQDLWTTITAGNTWRGQLKNHRKDGSVYWVDTTISPMFGHDNQIEGYMAARFDITQQKEAEVKLLETMELLKTANLRFEKVAEATNDAVWDWDLVHDHMTWGGGFKERFGHDYNRANKSDRILRKHIHPEDITRIVQSLSDTLSNPDEHRWQQEYRYKRANGSYAHVIDRGLVVRNHTGKAVRMVGAMTDISYQKEHEKELVVLNTKLELRARELAKSNQELEQFAFVASHDLQEPLRMVDSFLTQLERRYGDLLDDKARQYIHFAVNGAKQMRQIILDLLEFSRVGRQEYEPEDLELQDIINEAKRRHHRRLEELGAIVAHGPLPSLSSFRNGLLPVVVELLENSLKFRHPDRIPTISITAQKESNEWVIQFMDNGLGIPADMREQVFLAFKRLHNNPNIPGNGMGLPIAKRNVENMGGRIWIEGNRDQGVSVFFSIPFLNKPI